MKIEDYEKAYELIASYLRKADGSVAQAAVMMGCTRENFYKYMRMTGLTTEPFLKPKKNNANRP